MQFILIIVVMIFCICVGALSSQRSDPLHKDNIVTTYALEVAANAYLYANMASEYAKLNINPAHGESIQIKDTDLKKSMYMPYTSYNTLCGLLTNCKAEVLGGDNDLYLAVSWVGFDLDLKYGNSKDPKPKGLKEPIEGGIIGDLVQAVNTNQDLLEDPTIILVTTRKSPSKNECGQVDVRSDNNINVEMYNEFKDKLCTLYGFYPGQAEKNKYIIFKKIK